jgi:hypothetical protein
MMVLSALRPDASLSEFLAYRARSASVRRLATNALIGGAAFAGAIWREPTGWLVLASTALCFFAYGAWGLLDRARSRPALVGRVLLGNLLATLCALCSALGVLAAAGLLLGVWAAALGTWIS